MKYKIGDEVKFWSDDSNFVQYGVITRCNKKTATVNVDGYKVLVPYNKLTW